MTEAAKPAPSEAVPDFELDSALQRYIDAQRDFSCAIALPRNAPDRARRIKTASEIQASARQELWQAQQQHNLAMRQPDGTER